MSLGETSWWRLIGARKRGDKEEPEIRTLLTEMSDIDIEGEPVLCGYSIESDGEVCE